MSKNTQDNSSIDIEARLAEAESRIAFQEDSLQTLGEQLFLQQQLLDQLQRSVQLLYQQLRDVREANGQQQSDLAADERPPHY